LPAIPHSFAANKDRDLILCNIHWTVGTSDAFLVPISRLRWLLPTTFFRFSFILKKRFNDDMKILSRRCAIAHIFVDSIICEEQMLY